MRENRTPGSTSGDWKRDYGSRTEARSESDGIATGPYRRRASPRLYPLDSESLVSLLDRHGVAYVLVGGLAAVAHGATRATFHIDIVPRWETHNLDALAGRYPSSRSN